VRAVVDSYLVFNVVVDDPRPTVIDHAQSFYAGENGGGEIDALPGLWSHTVVATSLATSGILYATATSTVSLNRDRTLDGSFSALGIASANWDDNVGPDARAYSLGSNDARWYLAFDLETLYSYSIDYTLTCCNSSLVLRQSSDNDTTIFDFRALESSPPAPTMGQMTGTLQAGRYTFVAFAPANFSDSTTLTPGSLGSSFDFSMQLTPVPAPASAWLMATGLLGLAGRMRLRRRHERPAPIVTL
jgi:hypothetical protein